MLLGGERVHLAKCFAAALEPLDLRAELLDLLVGERFGLAALGEARHDVLPLPRRGRRASTAIAESLSAASVAARRSSASRAPRALQLLPELTGAAAARVHARPQGRLEA